MQVARRTLNVFCKRHSSRTACHNNIGATFAAQEIEDERGRSCSSTRLGACFKLGHLRTQIDAGLMLKILGHAEASEICLPSSSPGLDESPAKTDGGSGATPRKTKAHVADKASWPQLSDSCSCAPGSKLRGEGRIGLAVGLAVVLAGQPCQAGMLYGCNCFCQLCAWGSRLIYRP